MNRWLFALMLVAVSLAGCTEGSSNDDPVVDDFRDDFDNQGTDDVGTDDEEPAESVTMHPSLAADATQGNAPFTVSFELTASASDDQGGPVTATNVTWAIFSEDESVGLEASGTDLPGVAEFTFDAAGTYTIIGGVNADHADEAFANVTVEVLAANEEPPAPEPETWWLYMENSCSDDGKLKKTEGGPDGGCIGTDSAASAVLAEGTEFWMYFFYSEGTSAGAPTGTPFSGSASFTALPGLSPAAVLDLELLANGDPVYSEVREGIGPAAGPIVVLTWDESLEASIPAGASLELRLRIRDVTTTGYAFPEAAGGSQADWIKIG